MAWSSLLQNTPQNAPNKLFIKKISREHAPERPSDIPQRDVFQYLLFSKLYHPCLSMDLGLWCIYIYIYILLHCFLVKYGPGGVTFLTHIHSNRCIIYVLFYRFAYWYILKWQYYNICARAPVQERPPWEQKRLPPPTWWKRSRKAPTWRKSSGEWANAYSRPPPAGAHGRVCVPSMLYFYHCIIMDLESVIINIILINSPILYRIIGN